jgi:hypothetical protein
LLHETQCTVMLRFIGLNLPRHRMRGNMRATNRTVRERKALWKLHPDRLPIACQCDAELRVSMGDHAPLLR